MILSKYVISDIHGHFDEFKEILKIIDFSDKDTLYILGDIIDRGGQSVELIEFVKKHKNIVTLLGNHEYMMYQFMNKHDYNSQNIWFANGGSSTYAQIYGDCRQDNIETKNKEDDLMCWIGKLPIKVEFRLNNINYVLCHANPFAKSIDSAVWDRIHPWDHIEPVNDDSIYIIGHTPILRYQKGQATLLKNEQNNLWYIDGGAAYPIYKNARLLCIRLDDLSEFSVKLNL